MSAVTITIGVASAICAGIALIMYVQAREKARVARIRLIRTLQERFNNIQVILSDMPPQYLPKVMRITLHQQSINTIQKLNAIKTSSKHDGYIAHDEQKIKELKESKAPIPPVRVDSVEHARNVRIMMQNLYKLLHLWQRDGSLPAEHAQQFMSHVAFLARQSKADLFADKAQQASKAGHQRIAIHNYHSAIEILKDVSKNPKAAENITRYRTRIGELSKIANKRAEELKEQSQKTRKDSDEWNEFLTPSDDDWKKKNTYDD